MVSRRTFLKYTGSTMLTLFGFDKLSGISRAIAAIPGGTLDPNLIKKFKTPLFIVPAMPKAGKIKLKGGKTADYYEVSTKQFSQQILPTGLPTTTVWGYGPVHSVEGKGPHDYHAPSLTIEAKWDVPVVVKWTNDLKDKATGDYLPHLLPVDPTLHWANPPGGTAGRDTRPSFAATPRAYEGPVPIVAHVHGMAGVPDHSDGYAEAWYLPAARNIPAEYAATGTWYGFFNQKANGNEPGWGRGNATFTYPNAQDAATLWYHDHTLGLTRLNVYTGPAGFYIIRGGPTGDEAVKNKTGGALAVLPGPAPKHNDKVASDRAYHEIPLVIQDRSFNVDGSLFYPQTRAFFDGTTGPFIPESDVSPLWNPEFFGNTIMVNGNTWPFQTVEQRRYRLRLLNACNSRFLILDFSAIPGIEVWMIGSEGSFLAAPVNMTTTNANRILLAPSERADVIVDFAKAPIGRHVLRNVGPDEPFGGGEPGKDFTVAESATTGQIMEFRVVRARAVDHTTAPASLLLPPVGALPPSTATRSLSLLEEMSSRFEDAPAQTLLGTVSGDPGTVAAKGVKQMWMDPITQNPAADATEIWEFYNTTEDAHPMHIHAVSFELVNRQPITVDEENGTLQIAADSQPLPPEPWELGRKDTIIAYPGQVTRVKMTFTSQGQYVWHCHILEHEDNEMMLPYRVGPVQPGQPEQSDHGKK
jgi:FtsP/CotA-like multicopper oxidase with cupredoxin domain